MATKCDEFSYNILVDVLDNECITLQAKECWDEFAYDTESPDADRSDPKSIGEIIVNAANYASAPSGLKAGSEHFTYFDRPVWTEPRYPQ